ncbi:terminal uridylyltransferase 7 [Osmerus eperlanus]|uniref:terminal uridylyltransferase 7 n=1 Tax=Osmerus eperlanus TaxID=29151 RepID=UPI002E111164
MEESGRQRYPKQGGRERGPVAEDADVWRSQDAGRVYNPQKERPYGGSYGSGSKKGGPLSGSPGGFKGGHSPSQREGFRRFPGSDNQAGGTKENWRDRPPQQRWKRGYQDEDQDETTADNSGGRQRNRDRRRGHGENDRGPVIDESALSGKELQGLRQAEEQIGKDEIFRLNKRSRSCPNALYSCSLCDVLLDSVPAAHRHIRDKWHKRRARERKEETMLTEILPPGPDQVSALGRALQGVVTELGMSDVDVESRRQILAAMQAVLLSVLPGINLRLYGSSCTKFGFKDSDINIDIQFPSHMHQPEVLLLVHESLSKSDLYVEMEADFHARVPVVICKEKKSGLVCRVSAGNDNAYQTTCYLEALASQDPLLLPLVLGFRHWAWICHVDRADEGGLPSYVLALMVIYFLQQRKEHILPSYLGHEIKEFSVSRLSDFSLTYLEDGFVHWGYRSAKDSSTPADGFYRKGKAPLVFQGPRSPPEAGLLWVEMLRFYSLEFNFSDSVISVRTRAVLSREAKDWPKKRIAVEDPFAVKRNVARTLNSQQMFEYILHCLKNTYKYFALPLNTAPANHKLGRPKPSNHKPEKGSDSSLEVGLGPLSDEQGLPSSLDSLSLAESAKGHKGESGSQDSNCVVEEEEEVGEGYSESDKEKERESADLGNSSLSEEEEEEEEEVYGREHLNSFTTEDEELFQLDEVSGDEPLSDEEGPCQEEEGEETVEKERETSGKIMEALDKLCYEFNKQAFTRGKSHTVVCSLCKRDGHLKKDCPEDFKKVTLDPLPPMTPRFLETLSLVCKQCYRDFAPDELELGVREHILRDLERFVRCQFAGAKLRLFGSSKNGFGFKQSDLDICMVLEGQETADDLDCISVIENVARLLRKHPDLRNILPITTAKVPIVKFYHVRTSLEGDISLYNTLALHNTNLLACYAAIDRRVTILCYVMKVFAKMCDIGDASRGSLSSYAYTLMVLFYLQQRSPPLIPVLQEIYDGDVKPEVLVDGWNVYFYDDMEALPSRWPQYQKNTESVGALWLGLLQFYTEEFDFREHVICIRQHAPLTTFNKQWTSKYIVIEDPFDLNHNLGAGLSRRMTNFIMKAFINGRRVFGVPVKSYPPEYPSQMEYFFDPEVLTEGELAPNDRCCRICGKIGHFMKDCPMRKKSKQRRDQEDRNRAEGRRDWAEPADGGREGTPWKGERWRRPEEKRCCFLCGSQAHMKKDCPQYRGPPIASAKEKDRQGVHPHDEKSKTRQKNVHSPQTGSLSSRHQGRAGQGRSLVD